MNEKERFAWGFFGGFMVVFFRTYLFACLHGASAWQVSPVQTVLICVFWLLFPIVSGFLSIACEPHTRLHAIYEGASAPAIFLIVAEAFHP